MGHSMGWKGGRGWGPWGEGGRENGLQVVRDGGEAVTKVPYSWYRAEQSSPEHTLRWAPIVNNGWLW